MGKNFIIQPFSFLFLIILCSITLYAIPSQEDFFSAESDFLVIQSSQNTILQAPMFYAPYDNTKISFDINNDGVFDYEKSYNQGGHYTYSSSWEITDGSKIHSSKPIVYLQVFSDYEFLNSQGGITIVKKFIPIPPISNFKTSYLLIPGNWKIISDSNHTIYVDDNLDTLSDRTISLNKNTSVLNLSTNAFLYSDKPFYAISNNSVAGTISTDFIAGKDKIWIIILHNNTRFSLDYNVDNVPDYTITLNKGNYAFNLTYGARITSDKNITVYDYTIGSSNIPSTKTYMSSVKTNSISNEFFIAGQGQGENLITVFSPDSAQNMTYYLSIYRSSQLINYSNISNNTKIPLQNYTLYQINSTLPLVDNYENYSSNNIFTYFNYSSGRLLAYKKIYLTTTPKTKIITPNSSTVINARIFNPYKDTTVTNIFVKFPLNNLFSMPVASINGRKASLINDGVYETFSKAVSVVNDGEETYFLFSYDGVLEPETYLDLDFSLATPQIIGVNLFSQATLSYNAPTWII